jgi:hypothetical protein
MDQAVASPLAVESLRSSAKVLAARRACVTGHPDPALVQGTLGQLSHLTEQERLGAEIRLLLLEIRLCPARQEAALAQARSDVAALKKACPFAAETRLLDWGLETQTALARGWPVPPAAAAGLKGLASPGSSQRMEAELLLAGRYR